jgi:hypothetical protein
VLVEVVETTKEEEYETKKPKEKQEENLEAPKPNLKSNDCRRGASPLGNPHSVDGSRYVEHTSSRRALSHLRQENMASTTTTGPPPLASPPSPSCGSSSPSTAGSWGRGGCILEENGINSKEFNQDRGVPGFSRGGEGVAANPPGAGGVRRVNWWGSVHERCVEAESRGASVGAYA